MDPKNTGDNYGCNAGAAIPLPAGTTIRDIEAYFAIEIFDGASEGVSKGCTISFSLLETTKMNAPYWIHNTTLGPPTTIIASADYTPQNFIDGVSSVKMQVNKALKPGASYVLRMNAKVNTPPNGVLACGTAGANVSFYPPAQQ